MKKRLSAATLSPHVDCGDYMNTCTERWTPFWNPEHSTLTGRHCPTLSLHFDHTLGTQYTGTQNTEGSTEKWLSSTLLFLLGINYNRTWNGPVRSNERNLNFQGQWKMQHWKRVPVFHILSYFIWNICSNAACTSLHFYSCIYLCILCSLEASLSYDCDPVSEWAYLHK